MNYEDDELERMRARREQRRNASQSGSPGAARIRAGTQMGAVTLSVPGTADQREAPGEVQAGEVLQEELPEKGAGSRK